MIEIKVKVIGEDKIFVEDFLEYSENVHLSKNDPTLVKLVEGVIKKFPGNVEEVRIIIKMEW